MLQLLQLFQYSLYIVLAKVSRFKPRGRYVETHVSSVHLLRIIIGRKYIVKNRPLHMFKYVHYYCE